MKGRFAAVMLVLILAVLVPAAPVCALPGPFTDVCGGEYYAEASHWLHRTGIFVGDGRGRLEPDSVFTRSHMAVVLARMTGQGALMDALSTGRTGWSDDAAIPSWARGAFVVAEARGWFVGRDDGTVAPTDHLTWSEIAMLLVRVTDNEHLAEGTWPGSAMNAARAMGLFSGLPHSPLPGLGVLRGQMVVATWAAVLAPTRLGLAAEGDSLLSLHHAGTAAEYFGQAAVEPAALTVEAALHDSRDGADVTLLLNGQQVSSVTDSEGRVRHTFTGLDPGTYRLNLEAEGYESSLRIVDVAPGDHLRLGGIVLYVTGHRLLLVEEVAELATPATVTVAGPAGSLGSGFCIGDGMIVTNYHVIEGQRQLSVYTHSGRQHQVAGVSAADPVRDLAVLTVPGLDIPHLELSEGQEVRLGQTVVVVGSPLGLAGTVSTGIISAPTQEILGRSFIQTTAPISPGSSGSPLLDLSGQVVGVITMAAIDPAAQTINFAIPSSCVIALAEKAGAPEDPPAQEERAPETLCIEGLQTWLAGLLEDTLFDFSSVMVGSDGDAVLFYLWVRGGDDCHQLLDIAAADDGVGAIESLMQWIAGFVHTHSQLPVAGSIVCWDSWNLYPGDLADAGWDVYGEEGHWISSRALIWIYMWEPDDYSIDW